MTRAIEPFPADYEASLILDEVTREDRIVYFDSCAHLPLRDLIANKITGGGKLMMVRRKCVEERERNRAVECRKGTYERVPVRDNWATLVIGECSLDEFTNGKEALFEFCRILAKRGKILLSGPVLRDNEAILGASFLSLNTVYELLTRIGFSKISIVDLTSNVLERLMKSLHYKRLAETMEKSKMTFILVKATKLQG